MTERRTWLRYKGERDPLKVVFQFVPGFPEQCRGDDRYGSQGVDV